MHPNMKLHTMELEDDVEHGVVDMSVVMASAHHPVTGKMVFSDAVLLLTDDVPWCLPRAMAHPELGPLWDRVEAMGEVALRLL